jgi:hypothetical protein
MSLHYAKAFITGPTRRGWGGGARPGPATKRQHRQANPSRPAPLSSRFGLTARCHPPTSPLVEPPLLWCFEFCGAPWLPVFHLSIALGQKNSIVENSHSCRATFVGLSTGMDGYLPPVFILNTSFPLFVRGLPSDSVLFGRYPEKTP